VLPDEGVPIVVEPRIPGIAGGSRQINRPTRRPL
jgi:hypothetical protein